MLYILKLAVPSISNLNLLTGVVLLTIPTTLLISFLLFYRIERPAIQYGKRFG
jgi:peptidoglycan/LPS O-acetylase OafA/YrhL